MTYLSLMSRLAALLLVLSMLVIACFPQNNTSFMKIPTTDELIDNLTIEILPSPSRVYACTDNVGGFWEGKTYNYNSHDGGYNIDGHSLLLDFIVFAGDTLLDRRNAIHVDILPHQVVHRWNGGYSESITVLPDENGLIISLESEFPVRWQFVPLFGIDQEHICFDDDQDTGLIFVDEKNRERYWGIKSSISDHWDLNIDRTRLSRAEIDKAMKSRLKSLSNVTDIIHYIVLSGTDKDHLRRRIAEIARDPGESVQRKKEQLGVLLKKSYFRTNDPLYDKALHWAKISGNALVVNQFGRGIWAGLPWFNQSWGRDTFIALPGISLVTGQFQDAEAVIRSFSDFQLNNKDHKFFGRIPNRVASPTDIIFNTADATPWLIREIAEYIFYTGDEDFAKRMFPVIERAIEGALKNFVDEQGFLTHDDADTWMDARIRGQQAWSPRGNRAVEIQALWYNQLRVSAMIAAHLGHHQEASDWNELADRVKKNFDTHFIDDDTNALFDHINKDGTPDRQIRPNQLFAVTIPQLDSLIRSDIAAGVVRQVISELTYPYGIASLSQDDRFFHPYHHDQIYHFDAAYHNGLCWHWNVGPAVSAMTRFGYQDLAFKLTRNLSRQILDAGMPGSLSELVEPQLLDDGSVKPSGTYTQAWSVSEFVRNWYQDYLGIRTNMLNRNVIFTPRLPGELSHVEFICQIGGGEEIHCVFDHDSTCRSYRFLGHRLKDDIDITLLLTDEDGAVSKTSIQLKSNEDVRVKLSDTVTVNGQTIEMQKTGVVLSEPFPALDFQTFRLDPELKCLRIPDYLESIRINEGQDWQPVE